MARTTAVQAPAYTDFDAIFIGDKWRAGRCEKRIEDVDPYRGDVLTSIPRGYSRGYRRRVSRTIQRMVRAVRSLRATWKKAY